MAGNIANDQTLDRTLRQVLASGNEEQNQHYPPNVFDTDYNLVTSFILTEGVKLFGESQYIKDLLRPYQKTILLPVVNGEAIVPPDYRHYTGISFYPNATLTGCMSIPGLKSGDVPTPDQLTRAQKRNRTKGRDVTLYEIDEYNYYDTHAYKFPTFKDPIGCIVDSSVIKVSPFEIPFIELHYIRQPKIYKYGYAKNLDDTFSYDPTMDGAVETEWRTNADELLYKGVSTLYAMRARDGELRDGMAMLIKQGLF